MRITVAMMIVLPSIMLVACNRESADPEQQALITQGKSLFEVNCGECHPRKGRGNYLKKIPATLLTKKTSADLKEWILGYGEHREMPSFDHLSQQELEALIAYLEDQIRR
jgi:mono/diheme cytochrome c family protein